MIDSFEKFVRHVFAFNEDELEAEDLQKADEREPPWASMRAIQPDARCLFPPDLSSKNLNLCNDLDALCRMWMGDVEKLPPPVAVPVAVQRQVKELTVSRLQRALEFFPSEAGNAEKIDLCRQPADRITSGGLSIPL